MKNFIQKYNIEESFKKIPEVTQKVLLASNWEQDVWVIAKKHHLLLDETEAVVQQIGLILLGVKSSDNLQYNLTEEADLLESEARDLIREVNVTVFIPIQEKIKELLTHPERADILTEIEDKPKETVVHKKLSEIFSIPQATSDHSQDLPKVYNAGEDPYHEPID